MKKIPDEELKIRRPDKDELKQKSRFPIVVVAENIRSLYNVGSIFRTSDGALIEKLWLCGYTGYPPRKEIDKTALGSVDTVPWEHSCDTVSVLKNLRNEGYTIVALEHTDCSQSYDEAIYNFPLCIVLGNEVDGISDEALELCHSSVEIPMYGLKQSLNVSVAYGIIVYHLISYFKKIAEI
ncbi:MAG: tRNA (guanosine(18)-2'-O)-methyltransferase [Spirochaetes bacterium ADurb.Bin218]|nr:RNA methyltransferase [Spirochaetota bacterium]OQA99019.1 MAG: tRNA (guanosine(18)-2'-O)-methyltransferase [Spirochaetes bacterium ADurb.Bin218]HOV08964.1 RNA methyltransferase [Spirochaetota bacterium]HPX90700.1 RNA methyltransferase [Spirochaetota bacterium]